MGTYYHMTPEKNVKSILKEGLIPGGRSKAFSGESELTSGTIFLGSDIDECRLQLDLFAGDEPGVRVKNWAIFEVHLPANYPIREDYEDYLYTTKPIPPRYLRLVFRDSVWRKKMLEEYARRRGERRC